MLGLPKKWETPCPEASTRGGREHQALRTGILSAAFGFVFFFPLSDIRHAFLSWNRSGVYLLRSSQRWFLILETMYAITADF